MIATLRPPLAVLAVLGVLLAVTAPAAAAPPATGDIVPGEVIVGLAAPATSTTRAALERRTGVILDAPVTARARRARVGLAGSVPRALARLRDDPAVRWAEPNRLHRAQAVPSDPLFGSQWALLNSGQAVLGSSGTPGADIGAPAAWDLTTGSDRVRVAVLDGGVDGASPDLAPNIGVVNPGEGGDGREANGADDDGNGFVDDWRGWDLVEGDNDPDDEATTRHGTTVTGVLGARGGDGAGIAGVTWTSRIIPVRGLDATGYGTTADLAAGITYAASMGARVLNASFGGPASPAIAEAIAAAPQMLVVAAAGNGGDDGVGDSNEAAGRVYPCSLALDNVVCVAASDQSDALATFSNDGVTRVDLAAPGVRILGPPPPGAGSAPQSGTSFAAPHVAGVAALVLARAPAASTRDVRRALLDGAERRASLAGRVATGARLDAPGALAAIPSPGPGPGGATGPAVDLGGGGARLSGTVPASGEPLAYRFDHGPTAGYGAATATRPLPPGPARTVTDDVARLPTGTPLHHRLVVFGIDGVTFGADAVSRTPPPAPPAAPAPPGAPSAAVALARRPALRAITRAGRGWAVGVRLPRRARVLAVVQRRRPAAPGRAARFTTVRGVRPRAYAAGTRRLVLGILQPGAYRVRVTVTGPGGPVVLLRSFVVPRRAPRP